MVSLIVENQEIFIRLEKEDIITDNLDKKLNRILENEKININIDFFKDPRKLKLIEKVKPIFIDFLELFDCKEKEAENISNRFSTYFIFSLMKEWKEHPEYYQRLEDFFIEAKSPWDEIGKNEREWLHYSAWLEKQVDEPMFSESFGLRQVYVPLRGYYNEEIKYRKDNFQYNKLVSPQKVA